MERVAVSDPNSWSRLKICRKTIVIPRLCRRSRARAMILGAFAMDISRGLGQSGSTFFPRGPMKLGRQLVEGRILERYKRFLADIEIDGAVVVAHTANTGSM